MKMRKLKSLMVIAGFLSSIIFAPYVLADTVDWTDWTNATTTGSDNEATGMIMNGGQIIDVTFTGDIEFAQVSGGGNYWSEFIYNDTIPRPYTGNDVVDNSPPNGELIALNMSSTNTLMFSDPVINPIMAILSMGDSVTPITYDFDVPFTLLSEGQGTFGDGEYYLDPNDNTILTGEELHGVIQFDGTFNSITWTSSPDEDFHGITVGLLPDSVAVVPEPISSTLFIVGGATLGFRRFRKKFKK